MQIFSSSQPDCENAPPSSPPVQPAGTKLKKPPPITPNRFNRFFNPRSSRDRRIPLQSQSYRALRDITSQGPNRALAKKGPDALDFQDLPSFRPTKRRRIEDGQVHDNLPSESTCCDSSPPRLSPCVRSSIRLGSPIAESPYFPARIQRHKLSRPKVYIDSRTSTTRFYSDKGDFHPFTNPSLPFCTASCKSSSLVAIGGENGEIRIIETAKNGAPDFSTTYISFKPHDNAIMDLAFSSDDYLLAAASGDQTASIIDMRTQRTLSTLTEHTSSLKQVSFQPGNDKVLATTSRDGVVALWDIRCSNPKAFNMITGGHHLDGNVKLDAQSIRGDASVTAFQFLPDPRSHLFITATDATAHIRLWDIRGRYNRRNRSPVPISITSTTPSHASYRHFGVSSLALSSDAARIFSVCKDGTIYAYATSHLALGQSYDHCTSSSHPSMQSGKHGLGPLYGLRHPKFRMSTFYIKAAVRKAQGDAPELLAVGSSDACAVLFSTDEETLRRESRAGVGASSGNEGTELHIPSLKRTKSSMARERSGEVMYNAGTPLIRGHSREVTSVTWTCDGELVTIGDDFQARVWREDEARARDLRGGGEIEGRRWGCGWADASAEWDEEDG